MTKTVPEGFLCIRDVVQVLASFAEKTQTDSQQPQHCDVLQDQHGFDGLVSAQKYAFQNQVFFCPFENRRICQTLLWNR